MPKTGTAGYKHGIKSFRKKLVQWEKRKLIGRVRESPKSCYYIFPGEKLLREKKKDRWRDYFIYNEDIESVRFHWQTGKIYGILTDTRKCFEKDSYINSDGPWFDFKFDRYITRRMIYGLYACLYDDWEEEESGFFEGLRKSFWRGSVRNPIILTRHWNEKAQKLLIEHYLKDEDFKDEIAWCHIKESYETKEDFLNAKLMTSKRKMTLREYIGGGAEKILNDIENPSEPDEKGFWRTLKEIFVDEKEEKN